jgi:hypothetical protein
MFYRHANIQRTYYLKNSFSYSGGVLCMWNNLPTGLRQTNNLNYFKAGCIDFSWTLARKACFVLYN